MRAVAMREPECGAIPPNVGGPIPCHLEPGHDGEHFSTSGCAGSEIRWTDSTPTEREAGDVGEVAAVLAAHVWWPGTPRDGNPGCYCGWRCPTDKGVSRHDLHAAHVSEQLAPLIAARVDRAEAEAAYAQQDYDARGERLWRLAAKAGHVPCESDNDATAELVIAEALDTAAAREQAARAEAEAKVARVEALLAGYDAWTGADPFDEFASSPKQRDQLRKALDGGE